MRRPHEGAGTIDAQTDRHRMAGRPDGYAPSDGHAYATRAPATPTPPRPPRPRHARTDRTAAGTSVTQSSGCLRRPRPRRRRTSGATLAAAGGRGLCGAGGPGPLRRRCSGQTCAGGRSTGQPRGSAQGLSASHRRLPPAGRDPQQESRRAGNDGARRDRRTSCGTAGSVTGERRPTVRRGLTANVVTADRVRPVPGRRGPRRLRHRSGAVGAVRPVTCSVPR